jgi:hypothetical protein
MASVPGQHTPADTPECTGHGDRRVWLATVFMPFTSPGRWQGADMLAYWCSAIVRGESINTADLRLRQRHDDARNQNDGL